MGGIAGPNLVTDGLVLCLDANNGISHAGGDTTWTDPVGSNDGTLVNEPALESDFVSSAEVTGGTVGVFGDYIVHTFTNTGSTNFVTNVPLEADVLIVAGGGGGGMDMGGGGGAGGLIHAEKITISAATHAIVVGSGGAGAPAAGTGGQNTNHEHNVQGVAGNNTTAFGYTANGGGYGGTGRWSYSTGGGYGSTGGSGGGVGGYGYAGNGENSGNTLTGSSATQASAGGIGFGNAGGNGQQGFYSGGGGGAGGVGGSATNRPHGGIGLQINIDGNNYYWAGGGGASGYVLIGGDGGAGGGGGGSVGTTTGGSGINTGSAGGGGNTEQWAQTPGGNAGANTGGGGGGGGHYNATNQGGNGGSGIVIVRYHRKYADRKFYFDFDGTDQYATTTWGNGLNPSTTSFSFDCWVKTDSTSGSLMFLAPTHHSGTSRAYFGKGFGTIGKWYGGIGNSNASVTSSADVTTNWTNVTFVMNSTDDKVRLYINGVLDATAGTSYNSFTFLSNFQVGRGGGTSSADFEWDGKISIVRIYSSKALTAAEVLQNFEANKGRFEL